MPFIVGIQERNQLSSRFRNPSIASSPDALIRLDDHAHPGIRNAPHNVSAAIRGPVVNYVDLKILNRLAQDGFNASTDVEPLIVERNDYREQWHRDLGEGISAKWSFGRLGWEAWLGEAWFGRAWFNPGPFLDFYGPRRQAFPRLVLTIR